MNKILTTKIYVNKTSHDYVHKSKSHSYSTFLCAKRKKRKGKFLYNILFKVFITLWQIDEENVETVTNFIFFGFKITVDGTAAM